MTLEERFEAIMKNCEYLQARNEEAANQNEYLRRQLGDSLRQKRRELRSVSSASPPGSARDDEEEEGPPSGGSLMHIWGRYLIKARVTQAIKIPRP